MFYVSLDSDEEVVSRLCWKEHHFSATPTPCFDDDDDDYENNDINYQDDYEHQDGRDTFFDIFDNDDEMVDLGDLAHLGFHSAAAHLRPQPTSFSRDQPF